MVAFWKKILPPFSYYIPHAYFTFYICQTPRLFNTPLLFDTVEYFHEIFAKNAWESWFDEIFFGENFFILPHCVVIVSLFREINKYQANDVIEFDTFYYFDDWYRGLSTEFILFFCNLGTNSISEIEIKCLYYFVKSHITLLCWKKIILVCATNSHCNADSRVLPQLDYGR